MPNDFEYEEMLNGELYVSKHILEENKSLNGKIIAQKINMEPIENQDRIKQLVKELFDSTGDNPHILPPVHVGYGRHTKVGDNFFANMDCIFLDVNQITIGNNVMLGPRVGLYTAGHPIDPDIRIEKLEFGYPITIKDNVWVGANSIILPGVTVGKNAVIAAGSVVTKDVPDNTIVGGNPAKLIREVSEKDKKIWNQKKKDYHDKRNLD
ncbi:sugar O-acetyltransferase [Vagococcus luciliae]|uniref:Acetyltransferase n=1 Tax=Vagococcus luciliae TaxID=2920380 RepID=A0ABY5NXF2_9ENTE|nr:sugar O-acetyltransferase [Vagococcus luciliae]UUV98212.1 Maltose O-acetyltransferase [Vagococcus luciliae]